MAGRRVDRAARVEDGQLRIGKTVICPLHAARHLIETDDAPHEDGIRRLDLHGKPQDGLGCEQLPERMRSRRKDRGDVCARRGHALAARQFRRQAHAKGKLLDACPTQVELQGAARFLAEADEPLQRGRGPHRRIARDRAGHEKGLAAVPALQELAAGARHAHGHVLHIGRSHRITSRGSSPCGQTAGRRRGRRQ